jgi:hypothetical protein
VVERSDTTGKSPFKTRIPAGMPVMNTHAVLALKSAPFTLKGLMIDRESRRLPKKVDFCLSYQPVQRLFELFLRKKTREIANYSLQGNRLPT